MEENKIKWTIFQKLMIGFIIVLSFSFVLIGISIVNMNQARTSYNDLTDQYEQRLQLIYVTQAGVVRHESGVTSYLLNGEKSSLDEYTSEQKKIEKMWNEWEENDGDDRSYMKMMSDLKANYDEYVNELGQLITAEESNKPLSLNSLTDQRKQIEKQAHNMIGTTNHLMKSAKEEANKQLTNVYKMMVIGLIVSFLLSLVIGLYISRSIYDFTFHNKRKHMRLL